MLVMRETEKSGRSLRACARRRHNGYPVRPNGKLGTSRFQGSSV